MLTEMMLNVGGTKLQHSLVTEKVFVYALTSEKPDIGIVRDCAVSQFDLLQVRALRLRFHRSYHVWNTK